MDIKTASHTLAVTIICSGVLSGCQEGGDGSDATVSDSSGTQNSGDESVVLSGCEVDTYQALMLEQVNAARLEPRDCGSDNYPATHALTYSCRLEEAAAGHSRDMADNNFFSHTGSDGLQVSHRVSATGYAWSKVGENIAAGYPSVDEVMQGWLDSPGHCGNIMSDRFQEFAVSRVDADSSDYVNYWTQVFASP